MRVAALIVFSWMGPATALGQSPPLTPFNTMRFSPAPGANNGIEVDGATTPGHLLATAGLTLDYAHQPFVLQDVRCSSGASDCVLEGTQSALVRYVVAAHVTAALSLWERLQIGFSLPMVLTSGERFSYASADGNPVELRGGDAFALSDPRLHVKGNLVVDPQSGIALGLTGWVTFPTGQAFAEERFVGDRLPTFGTRILFDWRNEALRVSANAGARWRDGSDFFSTYVGSELVYGVALTYDITPLFLILAEASGAAGFSDQVDEHSLEWRAGSRVRFEDVALTLAGGTGLLAGVGVPTFRVLGGLRWVPLRHDQDGDGVQDESDACPSEPEDRDNWFDEDGCPEPDNDQDGLLDAEDPCPTEAEDRDNHEDEDGCPDRDNDGDGIPDGYDSCPNRAEDIDNDHDADGCPDFDSDQDGIPDEEDQCAEEAEDFDGFGDEDGCPEDDFDGDGLPDDADQCPDQAEDLDGVEDTDGCPEAAQPPAVQPQRARRRRRRAGRRRRRRRRR